VKKFCLLALACVIAGCSSEVQTSSGREYLAKYNGVGTASRAGDKDQKDKTVEERIRDAAAVEPILKFPARIGLARIDQGHLAAIPQEEAEAWGKARDKLGNGFGEFVALSPLVAEMVADRGYGDVPGIVSQIRLGAARQHLDAVLVYEEHSTEETSNNALSFAKVTVIGGFLLPSESHTAQGYAEGILIDVIQGYPYGNIRTVVDKQTRLSSAWGWGSSYDAKRELAERVKIQAGRQLADEAPELFMRLRTELAERRAK